MESNIYGIGYIDGQARTQLYNLEKPSNIDGNIIKIISNVGSYSYIFTDKHKLYRKGINTTDTLSNYVEILTDIDITDIINTQYVLSGSIIYTIDGIVFATNVEKVLGTSYKAGYDNFICYKTGDQVYHFWEASVEFTNLQNTGVNWEHAILLSASGSGTSRTRSVILYNENTLGYWNNTTKYTAPKTIKKVVNRDISTASHQPLILYNDGTLAQGTNFGDISSTFPNAPYYDIQEIVMGAANYTCLASEEEITFYKNYGSYGTTQVLSFPGKYVGCMAIYRANSSNSQFNTYTSFIIVSNIVSYDWSIKDPNDETLVTIKVKPALAAYLSINEDNVATLTVTDVLGGSVNANFNVYPPKGYGLGGLDTDKEAITPDIPVNMSTLLYGIATNLDLYIIYQKELPKDAVPANLYFMSCETNKIDKTNFLTLDKSIIGVFRSSVDILRPHLILQLEEYPEFNYVYLPRFKRYYFVTSKTNVSKDIYDIGLEVDVLYTYKDIIGTNYAVLSRTSNTDLQSPNLVDGKLPLQNNDNVIVIESTQPNVFNVDNAEWNNVYRYILTAFSGKPLEPVNVQH